MAGLERSVIANESPLELRCGQAGMYQFFQMKGQRSPRQTQLVPDIPGIRPVMETMSDSDRLTTVQETLGDVAGVSSWKTSSDRSFHRQFTRY